MKVGDRVKVLSRNLEVGTIELLTKDGTPMVRLDYGQLLRFPTDDLIKEDAHDEIPLRR